MSLLEELAVSTSTYVNNKVREVLVVVEENVDILEQKIKDVKTDTKAYVDTLIAEAKTEFVLKTEMARELIVINQKIDDNYSSLDDKKIDKTEANQKIDKVRNDLLAVTSELDTRKIDKAAAEKLVNDLNTALTDTINILGKNLQDQINLLKINKADKDNVAAEFANIRDLLNQEILRATEAEEALDTKLKTEVIRAKNQESSLSTSITNERNRALQEENTLTVNLNKEISRAKSKESDLQNQIDDNNTTITTALNEEISRAKFTEGDLQNQLTAMDTKFTFDINNEAQLRLNADNALQGDIDTQKDRIDSILALSTSDKDSFKEIVDFINAVDLENDETFAGYVVSNNKAVQANKDAISSEIIRAATSEDVIQHQINIETARASKREKEISLDLEDEIIRAKAAEASNKADINDETVRATAEERNLQEQITNNDQKHTATEETLNDDIENEIIRAIDSERTIQNSVNIETARASKREKEISLDLAEEIVRAQLKENEIIDNLNMESDRARSKEEYLNDLISQENIRAVKEEGYLDSKIDNESSRAKLEENALTDKINNEINDRIAGDDKLNDKIDTEILISRTKENSLRENIIQEESRAKTAEKELSDDITGEVHRAKEVEADLQEQIDANRHDFIAGDDLLSSNIEVERLRIDAILKASAADKDTFAEIVTFVNSIDLENDNELMAFISTSNAKDKALSDKIILETARALKEEGILDAKIDTEINRATVAEANLENSIADEESRAKKIEQFLLNNMDAQKLLIVQNETSISDLATKINVELNKLKTKIEDNYNTLDTKIDDQNTELSNKIGSETIRAIEKETALQAEIDSNKETLGTSITNLENEVEADILALFEFKKLYTTNLATIFSKITVNENGIENNNELITEVRDDLTALERVVSILLRPQGWFGWENVDDWFSYLDEDIKKNSNDIIKLLEDTSNNKDNLEENLSKIYALTSRFDQLSTTLDNAANIVYDDTEIISKIDTEIARANTKENQIVSSLTNQIQEQEERINDILVASDTDSDSFAEIVEFINAIDTDAADIAAFIKNTNKKIIDVDNSIITTSDDLKTKINRNSDAIQNNEININKNKASVDQTISEISRVDSRIDETVNEMAGIKQEIHDFDVTPLTNSIDQETRRTKAAEEILQNNIDDSISSNEASLNTLTNKINDIKDGRTIPKEAKNAQTLGGKDSAEFLLKKDYRGLAEEGKALSISGNTLTLTSSNGFQESVDLPSSDDDDDDSNNRVFAPRSESNTLRSAQYVSITNKEPWVFIKSVTLDAGIYNYNLISENRIQSWRKYEEQDDIIGHMLILPQGDFDSYGCLTKDDYENTSYKSKTTNKFNMMNLTQDDNTSLHGQLYLKERQEVRILIRSTIYDTINFFLKTQIYRTY